MSGSEAAERALNSVNDDVEMQTSPLQSELVNMRPTYSDGGVTRYTPLDGNEEGMGTAQPAKKRRGRPRKYGPGEGPPFPAAVFNTLRPSMAISSPPPPPPPPSQQHQPPLPPLLQQQPPPPPPPLQAQPPLQQDAGEKKRAKGRPRGSGSSGRQKQLDACGSVGIGFTTHVFNVNTGQDVSSRIMSFSNSSTRAICILAASGTISNVILNRAVASGDHYKSSSSDYVTYEGHFQILSISGSLKPSKVGGPLSTTGALSVTLAGPDGRVFGGVVAGRLIAASPVQVVAGSFIADEQRQVEIGNLTEPLFSPAKPHAATGPTGPSSSQSPGINAESSGGPGSPLNQSTGAVNSTELGMLTLPWK